MDFAIAFGLSAVMGLAFAEQSGPTTQVKLGGGYDLSLPAQAWQYGLWLAVFLAFGSFGAWVMSFGGRAEVTMREDGIQWLIRGAYRFYPYARMQACLLERADGDPRWQLRMTMRPERAGDPETIDTVRIAKHIDVNRVRLALQSAGVATSGWQAVPETRSGI